MCGITGILYFDRDKKINENILIRMTDSLAHRGPDDRGIYIKNNIGLGFRRLSIIDLSSSGHQPMTNETGEIWIVFNGEIYNYIELRTKLKKLGHIFKSNTDTEVIIHAYEEYSVDCLNYIDGMFAFSIWDERRNQLFVARDRFGIKPFNYIFSNDYFAFGSEIKAILQIPNVSNEIDYDAVWNYFSLMQIPAPQTIYKNIRKLLPGHAIVIDSNGDKKEWEYWKYEIHEDNSITEKQFIEEIRDLFEKAVYSHLMADVPVGVLLSGGIDSSTIVAYASKLRKERISTFSVSFKNEGKKFDERNSQIMISQKYNTQHHEIIATANMLEVAELLIKECDEPFAVSSAIPLYYVTKLASEKVKVVLSGDGGDELFAGYEPRYKLAEVFGFTDKLPMKVRDYTKKISNSMPYFVDKYSPLRKIKKALLFSSISEKERYLRLLSIFQIEEKLALFNSEQFSNLTDIIINDYYIKSEIISKNINGKLLLDINTGLHDEMLTKTDRVTSMLSVEGRLPFLDSKFASLSSRIPFKYKYKINQGKIILRKSFKNIVPEEILIGKKKGFNVPMNLWQNNDFMQDYYNPKIFNLNFIKTLYDRHFHGDKRFGNHIWLLKNYSIWENLYL